MSYTEFKKQAALTELQKAWQDELQQSKDNYRRFGEEWNKLSRGKKSIFC